MLHRNHLLASRRNIGGLCLVIVIAPIALAGFRFPVQTSMRIQAPLVNELATNNRATARPDHFETTDQNSPQESTEDTKVSRHERGFVKPDNFTMTVIDADTKQPIAAASITVWGIDQTKSMSDQTLMKIDTDKDGQFRFQNFQARYPTADEGEPGPSIILGIKKEGYATTVIKPTCLASYRECPAAFTVSLPAAEGLKGRVVDEDEHPIVGAKVWKHGFLTSPIDGFFVETDETGHFLIDDSVAFRERWISKNSVMATMFFIEHTNYGQSRGSVTHRPPIDGPIQFKLNRVFSVSGRVGVESSSPVDKIRVVAYPIHSPTRGSTFSDEYASIEPISRVSALNEHGEFRFRLPSNAEYFLVPVDPNQELGAPATKVFGGAGQKELTPEIRVEPMVEVEGYVVGHDSKKRVAFDDDLAIRLMWHGEDYPKEISPVRSVAIEHDGSFNAKMVPGRNFPYIATVVQGKEHSSKNHFEMGILAKPDETKPLVMELEVFEHNRQW